MIPYYRILALLLVTMVLFVPTAASYGVLTHAAISRNAWNAAYATTIQRNFFQALQLDPQHIFGPVPASPPAGAGPFTAQGWITAGSQYEDDQPLPVLVSSVPATRVLFHFLDP